MTQTCKSCHEDPEICHFVGTDRRECEHPVRIGDVEVSTNSQPETESMVDCPFHDQCSEIITRLRRVERALCDIGRAAKGELL